MASVDNRGTPAPRGREWRRSVYRQIGVLATHDQAAAVRAMLGRWPEADAGRVGVWGWSGGGSMSLNAIFRYPDLYSTAIAVTNFLTTPFTRSATWACRAITPKATAMARR